MAEANDVYGNYRKELLGSVRTGQKQMDCLGFLVYKLKRR